MNTQEIIETEKALVTRDKGLLAMDESNPTCNNRFAALGIPQNGEARLNSMNVRFKSRLPWPLAFSFSRAIQQPALEIWRGKEDNVPAAQQTLLHRARCNRDARRGDYNTGIERQIYDNTVYKHQK